jgi:hypothetical protein
MLTQAARGTTVGSMVIWMFRTGRQSSSSQLVLGLRILRLLGSVLAAAAGAWSSQPITEVVQS